MSASTIARWNAIPMEKSWDGPSTSHKRSRSPPSKHRSSVGMDSDDDDVSLVSRSPSPEAIGRRGGDADPDADVLMYDEHSDVRGVAREQVTVNTKISSSNKGFAMLARMGWTEGKPVGISGDGRIDPVPFTVKYDSSGLGKYRQDFEVIETTVSQRKTLDSERMQNETSEQRQQREASVAQKAAVASEVSQTLRAFYCDYCDKQFANVAQYDEHTNSYAHHHKVRAKDMASHHPVRAAGKEEADKRKEKERKREEKELKKIAKAAGIKIGAPLVNPPAPSASASGNASKDVKKSGWASVGSGSSQTSTVASATSNGGGGGGAWATVSTPAQPAPPRNAAWRNVSSTQGFPSAPATNAPEVPKPPTSISAFRSGGFTTLQTSIAQPNSPPSDGWSRTSEMNTAQSLPSTIAGQPPAPPPPEPELTSLSPPPPPPPSTTTFTQSSPFNTSSIPPPPNSSIPSSIPSFSSPGFPSTSLNPPSRDPASFTPTLPPPSQPHHQPIGNVQPLGSGPDKKLKSKKKREAGVEGEEPQSRGNWQSFQRGRGRR